MAFNMTAMRMHLPSCRLNQRCTSARPSTAPAAFAPVTSLNSGLSRPLQTGEHACKSLIMLPAGSR